MRALGRRCLAILLTVAMLFTLVGTAAAETSSSGPSPAPFLDTYGTPYRSAVDALYELGIVSGITDKTYEPGSLVTRAQMAALVVRALGKTVSAPTTDPFKDVPRGHWAAGVVATASELGIVKGDNGFFMPDDPVTLPQVTAMLLRAVGYESLIQGGYPTGYVLKANELGLLEGIEFALDKNAMRGPVALMLYRTVFFVPRGGVGPTISQSVFARAGRISIDAAGGDVVVQGNSQLQAQVFDWVGKKLDNRVEWRVISGNATISAGGVLNVTGQGAVAVEARSGNVTASKTYSVLESLSVTADKTAVKLGETVQLSAVGKSAAQTDVAVQPSWSIVSGNGTITKDGVLTISGGNAVKVRGTVGSMSGEVTVNVIGGISISPQNAVVAANSDLTFTAQVTDAGGQALNVPVTWSVVGGGTIDQNGKYRAGTTPGTVVAKAGSLSAETSVRVVNRLEVTPGVATLRKGEARQFSATVYTPANVPVPATVTWNVEPSNIGFLSKDGNFFAQASGSGFVVATYGGLTTRIPVTVAGQAVALRLSASQTSVPANGNSTVTLTARLVDANGVTAAGVDTVMFTLSNSKLGALDKSVVQVVDGVATATLTVGTQSGAYFVYASAPGSSLPSTTLAISTTVPSISRIQLDVYPNPMAADGTSRTKIVGTLIDSTGSPMVNTTGNAITAWVNQNNTTAGRLVTNQIIINVGQKSGSVDFIASNTPGNTVITGSSNFPVNSTTVTSQVVGAAYALKIRPAGATTVKADGSSEVVLNVEVQDANGNVRTGDNSVFVSINAASGSNTLSVSSQQTVWGVASFKLKSSKAGTYDVRVWATNQSLQGDTTQVTFTSGTPYKLALTTDPNTSLAADARTTALLKATVLDVNGNVVTGATNQVRFIRETSSQYVTTMPSVTSANAVNGEATLQITTTAGVGTDYFKAEADGLITSPTIAVITRITGVPVKLSVQSLSQATIPAGGQTSIRVAVLDQLNQIVTGDNGRLVTLLATNGATVSGPTATVNGVATFTVSNTASGGVGLTAVAEGVSPDLIGRVLTVAAGTPDHVVLSASPEALSADSVSRTNIRGLVVDRFGNPTGTNTNVTLSLSTSDYLTMSSPYLTTSGNVTVTAKGTPGTTTITGVSTSYAVKPLTISTYRAGVPTRVVLDQLPASTEAGAAFRNQVVVKARILDDNGNMVTSLNTGNDVTSMALLVSGSSGNNSTNVTLHASTGLSAYQIYPNGVTVGSASVSNGVAQFTITNTKAETITLTPVVYYRGVRLQGEPQTFTTVAGPATRLTLLASSTAVPSSSPTLVTVTASVTDSYGNLADSQSDTITFSIGNSPYFTAPSPATVTTTNGQAVTTVTSNVTGTGGAATITATSSRYGFSGALTLATDRMPDKPTVVARDSNGNDSTVTSSDAGARITVIAPYRNSAQQVMVYINGITVTLYADTTFTVPVDSIPVGMGSLTGYVKYSDLGGPGIKDVRAVVSTGLGLSPLSDGATLTVQ